MLNYYILVNLLFFLILLREQLYNFVIKCSKQSKININIVVKFFSLYRKIKKGPKMTAKTFHFPLTFRGSLVAHKNSIKDGGGWPKDVNTRRVCRHKFHADNAAYAQCRAICSELPVARWTPSNHRQASNLQCLPCSSDSSIASTAAFARWHW